MLLSIVFDDVGDDASRAGEVCVDQGLVPFDVVVEDRWRGRDEHHEVAEHACLLSVECVNERLVYHDVLDGLYLGAIGPDVDVVLEGAEGAESCEVHTVPIALATTNFSPN